MITAEIKNDVSTVRIHNEFCGQANPELISRLGEIISESYRRRSLVPQESTSNQPIQLPRS